MESTANSAKAKINFKSTCEQTKRIPAALSVLGERIETVSSQNAKREEFYTWYSTWYLEAEAIIEQAKQSLTDLEQSALCDGCASLEQRHAVKEAIDLEPLVDSIGSQLSILASGIGSEMRFGHIWKIWSVNLRPSCKKLELAIRKFCVSSAGL